MTVVLAVSPHLDDAVFSAGGTLARLAEAGARVVVATVFTATVPDPQGFALACQLDKGLGPEADYMALRRAEDVRACTALGAEHRHLPFREAPHRGYGSAAALFAAVRTDDDAAAVLRPVLRAMLDELEPSLVLAPQGVGGHVDHVAVVRAVRAAAPGAALAWWRDHPYTLRTAAPAEPFADDMRALDLAEVALSGPSHAAKIDAALAYESQLGFQFGSADLAREIFAGAEPGERFRTEGDARRLLAPLAPSTPSGRS